LFLSSIPFSTKKEGKKEKKRRGGGVRGGPEKEGREGTAINFFSAEAEGKKKEKE